MNTAPSTPAPNASQAAGNEWWSRGLFSWQADAVRAQAEADALRTRLVAQEQATQALRQRLQEIATLTAALTGDPRTPTFDKVHALACAQATSASPCPTFDLMLPHERASVIAMAEAAKQALQAQGTQPTMTPEGAGPLYEALALYLCASRAAERERYGRLDARAA